MVVVGRLLCNVLLTNSAFVSINHQLNEKQKDPRGEKNRNARGGTANRDRDKAVRDLTYITSPYTPKGSPNPHTPNPKPNLCGHLVSLSEESVRPGPGVPLRLHGPVVRESRVHSSAQPAVCVYDRRWLACRCGCLHSTDHAPHHPVAPIGRQASLARALPRRLSHDTHAQQLCPGLRWPYGPHVSGRAVRGVAYVIHHDERAAARVHDEVQRVLKREYVRMPSVNVDQVALRRFRGTKPVPRHSRETIARHLLRARAPRVLLQEERGAVAAVEACLAGLERARRRELLAQVGARRVCVVNDLCRAGGD
eukprot:scaffold69155_cov69-Phaeocystis_antarctica.AAC.2